MDFKNLHSQPAPFLLGNVWDVSSAKACRILGIGH